MNSLKSQRTAQIALIAIAAAAGSALPMLKDQAMPVVTVVAIIATMPMLSMSTQFRDFSIYGKLVLALFLTRPLADIAATQQTGETTSLITAQAMLAAVFILTLALSWISERRWASARILPNLVLLALILMATLDWLLGGLHSGTTLFSRTVWAWLVLLLAGHLFDSPNRLRTFVLAVYWSSALLLMVLVSTVTGDYYGEFWRLSGQYGVPNTLAAIVFGLFLYGLFAIEELHTPTGKVAATVVEIALAVVIILSQSKTIGALMVISTFFWLWTTGHRKVVVALASGAGLICLSVWNLLMQWRVLGVSAEEVQNLTGRTTIWAAHTDAYLSANWLHKLTGLGWGTVMANFEALGIEQSSVTENSYLWLLVGGGIISLGLFCVYMGWLLRRSWQNRKIAPTQLQQRLSLFTFLITAMFLMEALTTDVLLSPIAGGYLLVIISAFVAGAAQEDQTNGKAEYAVT